MSTRQRPAVAGRRQTAVMRGTRLVPGPYPPPRLPALSRTSLLDHRGPAPQPRCGGGAGARRGGTCAWRRSCRGRRLLRRAPALACRNGDPDPTPALISLGSGPSLARSGVRGRRHS
eukprot:scaffold5064_cov115-Isochrysis_galbana.AAC.11